MGKAKAFKQQRKIEKAEKLEKKKQQRKMILTFVAGFVVTIVLGLGLYKGTIFVKNKFFAKNENNQEAKVSDKKYDKAPAMTIDTAKTYVAKFETNQGNFEVTLDAKNAPKTTNNFVFLARDKFFDGLTFHRIVKDFMIQGGDPKGDGTGDPGYKFDDEAISGDYTPGTIAMANSGKNTNGSQFFIMTGDYSNGKLPKDYVIFGKVTAGMDVVNKFNAVKTEDSGQGETSKPVDKQIINKVTIEEK